MCVTRAATAEASLEVCSGHAHRLAVRTGLIRVSSSADIQRRIAAIKTGKLCYGVCRGVLAEEQYKLDVSRSPALSKAYCSGP